MLAAMAAGRLDAGPCRSSQRSSPVEEESRLCARARLDAQKVGRRMNGLHMLRNSAIRNMEDPSGKRIAGSMRGTEPWLPVMDLPSSRNVLNYRYIELEEKNVRRS